MFVFSCFTFNTKAQCNTPTLSILAIVADSVSLSWTTSGSVTNVEYVVLPAAAAQPTSGTPSTGTSAGVGSLSAGTGYKAWIKANCPGSPSSSAWLSTSFSTPCGVPSTIAVSNVQGDSADISWTAVSPGANYQYAVGVVSTPPASGTSASTNSIRIKSLLPAKTYYVFVRTDCGGGSYSFWSAAQSFYTPFPTSTQNIQSTTNAISIYPNPVNDILFMKNIAPDSKIVLTNTMGAIQYENNMNNKVDAIDVSKLASGLYILHVYNNNENHVYHIHKL
jgi:hypothetical protein